MIRCAIIEDEVLSRMYLNSLLTTWCSNIEVIATAANCEQAINIINELKPDLIFLDIELLNCNAFDVIKALQIHYPKIIFTTALGDTALKIIKPSGLPFLQKPIDNDDLLKIIKKTELQNNQLHHLQLQQLLQTLRDNKPVNIFIEPGNGEPGFINTSEIVLIESLNAVCRFMLSDGNTLQIINYNIKDCESFLCDDIFFRLSHKHIVNTFFIDKINISETPSVLLKNGLSVPLSAKKIDALKNML